MEKFTKNTGITICGKIPVAIKFVFQQSRK